MASVSHSERMVPPLWELKDERGPRSVGEVVVAFSEWIQRHPLLMIGNENELGQSPWDLQPGQKQLPSS
jgi:hypothetical protein